MENIPQLELKILNLLWNLNKPVSVQDVIDVWDSEPEPGYTTVLKKLQIMEKKELVAHEKSGKMYLYYPAVEQGKVRKNKLSSFLSDVFQNDPVGLFSTLVDSSEISEAELIEIKKIIEGRNDG
jgi:BlaI family transcriptional regulator, penicillinase repressor